MLLQLAKLRTEMMATLIQVLKAEVPTSILVRLPTIEVAPLILYLETKGWFRRLILPMTNSAALGALVLGGVEMTPGMPRPRQHHPVMSVVLVVAQVGGAILPTILQYHMTIKRAIEEFIPITVSRQSSKIFNDTKGARRLTTIGATNALAIILLREMPTSLQRLVLDVGEAVVKPCQPG
jgi:hypothetical protein